MFTSNSIHECKKIRTKKNTLYVETTDIAQWLREIAAKFTLITDFY